MTKKFTGTTREQIEKISAKGEYIDATEINTVLSTQPELSPFISNEREFGKTFGKSEGLARSEPGVNVEARRTRRETEEKGKEKGGRSTYAGEVCQSNSSFLQAPIPVTYVQVLVFTTSNPYYPISMTIILLLTK